MSNQYLDAVGTLADVVLSEPIKPMHVIFKGKGTLVQNDNYIVAGGPIVNICIVYKTSPKTINSDFVFKNCLFRAVKIANTTNTDILLLIIKYFVYVCIIIAIIIIYLLMVKKLLNYDFSVDYSAITNVKIVDIHNYFMKKN